MSFADAVMLNELESSIDAFDVVTDVVWAAALVARTREIIDRARVVRTDAAAYRAKPVTADDKSLLFELRYARELALRHVNAEYEYAAGVGSSTVDFRLTTSKPWLIELVSFRESAAFKAASWQSESRFGYVLQTGAEDPRQSGEGELIKAQERLIAKVFDGKQSIKFPVPSETINMVLVDARGFMGDGHGDIYDWKHLLFGARAVPEGYAQLWKNPKTGVVAPIAGIFESSCPLRGAEIMRTKIHLVGFVCERTYSTDEIQMETICLCNPHLFANEEEARATLAAYPLGRK